MRSPQQAEWPAFAFVGSKRNETVTKPSSPLSMCKKTGSAFERKQIPRIDVSVWKGGEKM